LTVSQPVNGKEVFALAAFTEVTHPLAAIVFMAKV